MSIRRMSAATVLACLVALGMTACREEAEPSAEAGDATMEEADSSTNGFIRTASSDLEGVENDLQALRPRLTDLERAEVDRWAERVRNARQELEREVMEAPEQHQRTHEQRKRAIEEIKSGVAELFARLRGRAPFRPGDEATE